LRKLQELLLAIARVGRRIPTLPTPHEIEAFRPFFNSGLRLGDLDERDGPCTRRELLTRYLLLNAVLDQGPDLQGVRRLMVSVINGLYRREVQIFHHPVHFFREIGLVIDEILTAHEGVKGARAATWAAENNTNAAKYNLFIDNSTQALNYAVFRWGVPLALPLVLDGACDQDSRRSTVLLDYIESYESAEAMSLGLKDHRRYGLGKAIGDKACHLFAKWFCMSFGLSRRGGTAWGPFSYEVPFDSNAGRVLWRTGFLLRLASLDEYVEERVVQRGVGKGGLDYIRVTNIRGMAVSAPVPSDIRQSHAAVCVNHLRSHSKGPTKVQIQRVPHALLLQVFDETGLGVADLDEGLIRIGTTFCFNHSQPRCAECPVSSVCEGYQGRRELIESYRT
jgi:hypothetical protein